jgi:hypothetical protein
LFNLICVVLILGSAQEFDKVANWRVFQNLGVFGVHDLHLRPAAEMSAAWRVQRLGKHGDAGFSIAAGLACGWRNLIVPHFQQVPSSASQG